MSEDIDKKIAEKTDYARQLAPRPGHRYAMITELVLAGDVLWFAAQLKECGAKIETAKMDGYNNGYYAGSNDQQRGLQ